MAKLALLILAGLASTLYAATTPAAVDTCADDPNEDCWARPDSNCFGIYKPWSMAHCPDRCGFCGRAPPCEDKIAECAQFEAYTCTQDNYKIWARTNCRKHCNLCHIPTPPAGGAPMTTGATAVTMPPATPTVAQVASGTVATGTQTTLIYQGNGSSTPGMCLYQGTEYKEAARWNVGCDYECSCLDARNNHVVCTEKCTKWHLEEELAGCSLVKEEGECCPTVQCK